MKRSYWIEVGPASAGKDDKILNRATTRTDDQEETAGRVLTEGPELAEKKILIGGIALENKQRD